MKRPLLDRSLLTAFCGSLALIICFDILWCMATTFRAMSFPGLWLNAVLFALVITLPFKITRRVWVHTVMLTLTAAWLEANLMYCRTYLTAIPAGSYLLAGNLADFGPSVADSLRWPDISLAAIVIGVGSMLADMPRDSSRLRNTGYILVTLLWMALCWLVSLIYGGPRAHIAKLTDSCYYTTTPPAVYTVPGVLINSLFDPADEEATPQMRRQLEAWMNEKHAERPFTPLPDSVQRRSSVAIILCESLESWPLEAEIGGVEITPALNRLIADTTAFYAPQMLTQVSSGRSIDAQLLLNAGMLPMEESVWSMRYPDRRYPSLSEAMHQRGARTYIVTGDKPITWNQARVAAAFRIDSLLDNTDWQDGDMIGKPAKIADSELASQSIAKMRRGEIWPEGEKAFAQWITYSDHNPFVLPEKLRDQELEDVIPEEWPQRLKDYVRMAHFTDRAVGELVDYIRSRSDAAQTLILITGDHEGLGNDREMMHRTSDGLVSDGPFTPFLLVNSPVTGRTDDIIGQTDMYPTLLSILGLESYPWKGMGENILTTRRAPAAISSMTRRIYSDTTAITPAAMRNLREARKISDMIIRADMMR